MKKRSWVPFALGAGVGAYQVVSAVRRRQRRQVLSESMSLSTCLSLHRDKVERVASQLRNRTSTRPLSRRKRSVSHQVPKAIDPKQQDDQVDITRWNAILAIDPVARTCTAEPGVTFVDLVAATMRYGLVPTVVPELKTITVGGAVAGCSIESMSFLYGGFHDSCLEYEVVTAKGEVITCTPDNENRLLFQMVHGTFGTLGILSKLTFRLVPAAPFVRVEYEKYPSWSAYHQAIRGHFERRDVDFMDGIIHSPTEYVLCLGRFVDRAPYTNRYDWMKVYYQSTRTRKDDYLTTPDYFFRYDRGVTNVHPKSAIGRFFFGKFLGSSQVLKLAETFRWLLPKQDPTIIVDLFFPASKVEAYLAWHERELKHFPLWCVPYRRVRDYEWIADRVFQGLSDSLFIDLAIYGMKQTGGRNAHKLIEDKLLELGGLKTLISHNYFSEEDFWKIWNKDNYAKVKQLTDPANIFRDLYAKTCRSAYG